MPFEYNGVAGSVRIDHNGMINLNDLHKFYPTRKISHWQDSPQTLEFVNVLLKHLQSIYPESGELTLSDVMVTHYGRYGGTYAHELLAMEFCMFLSPEFKLEVLLAYQAHKQHKQEWNFKRHLAATGYKLMSASIDRNIASKIPVQMRRFEYMEEADMINLVVFGKRADGKSPRETATIDQLNLIGILETLNTGMIEAGMERDKRYARLLEVSAIPQDKILGERSKVAKLGDGK